MNSLEFTILPVNWQEQREALQHIRTRVFIEEQQVPEEDEWDGLDENAQHFLVKLPDNQSIATARVLTEKDQNGNPRYHIGRVAVMNNYRNHGIGHHLMCRVVDWCQQGNQDKEPEPAAQAEIYLHAQISRVHFYEQLKFVTEGSEFIDAGIPHITMRYHP
jgi:predicted GNAT family N-acyltransferase